MSSECRAVHTLTDAEKPEALGTWINSEMYIGKTTGFNEREAGWFGGSGEPEEIFSEPSGPRISGLGSRGWGRGGVKAVVVPNCQNQG